MTKDQNPSDKACDAYFDNPCAATSGSYYSDRATFYAGFKAGAASRDAEIAELKAALQAVSDDWDGEHFHNGGSSFMPVVNAALGRGEQEWT